MAGFWDELSDDEKEFERKAQASRSYSSLFFSAAKTLRKKQAALESLTTFVVVASFILFGLWLWHEDSWQSKLDKALSGCTVSLTDGTCMAWDVNQIRDKLR
jgi:putative Ca2+/H+ antiporter (TMEM165/GDT1 family)